MEHIKNTVCALHYAAIDGGISRWCWNRFGYAWFDSWVLICTQLTYIELVFKSIIKFSKRRGDLLPLTRGVTPWIDGYGPDHSDKSWIWEIPHTRYRTTVGGKGLSSLPKRIDRSIVWLSSARVCWQKEIGNLPMYIKCFYLVIDHRSRTLKGTDPGVELALSLDISAMLPFGA